jgi:DNA-binding transcriptional ArsR family regulator
MSETGGSERRGRPALRLGAGADAPDATAPADRSAVSPWQGLSPGFVRAAAANRLKALSHPDRLRIVEALAGGPKTVGQIAATVGRPMNVVSRNLRVLRDAQVVQCSKRRNSVLYVLTDRDVARLAAVAYRGAGGQLRKVVSLAPAAAEIVRADLGGRSPAEHGDLLEPEPD